MKIGKLIVDGEKDLIAAGRMVAGSLGSPITTTLTAFVRFINHAKRTWWVRGFCMFFMLAIGVD